MIAAINHLGHEIAMCLACAVRTEHDYNDTVSRLAVLEAHLLHTRALIEFLLREGRLNDIRRESIVPGWTPRPTDAVERLDALLLNLQRHVSHLTWRRVTDGTRQWNVSEHARDIRAVAGN